MSDPSVVRRIMFDATPTIWTGATTGIPRVVRSLESGLREVAEAHGVEFEILYFDGRHYRLVADRGVLRPSEPRGGRQVASKYVYLARAVLTRLRRMIANRPVIAGSAVWEPRAGDALVLPDAVWRYDPWAIIRAARAEGVAVHCLIHDLLPIKHPTLFLPEMVRACEQWWAQAAAQASTCLCVSRAVMADVRARLPPSTAVTTAVVPLGYDFTQAVPAGPAPRHLEVLSRIEGPCFVMVGTLEPRKNHALVLDAFERVWRTGSHAILFVVGRRGWMADGLARRLRRHEEFGRRLFWFENCPDRDLECIYRRSDALVAASIDEGYGLPVVEARARGLAVLASDIPVFREVAGEAARFFPVDDPGALARLIVATAQRNPAAPSVTTTFASWQDTAEALFDGVTRAGTHALTPGPGAARP